MGPVGGHNFKIAFCTNSIYFVKIQYHAVCLPCISVYASNRNFQSSVCKLFVSTACMQTLHNIENFVKRFQKACLVDWSTHNFNNQVIKVWLCVFSLALYSAPSFYTYQTLVSCICVSQSYTHKHSLKLVKVITIATPHRLNMLFESSFHVAVLVRPLVSVLIRISHISFIHHLGPE